MKRYRNPEWLREEVEKGLSFSQIAKIEGVTSRTVRHWTRKFGISPKRKETSYRDENWLRTQFKSGFTTENIKRVAKICEVHPETIRVWLHRFGLPVPPRPQTKSIKKILVSEIKELFEGILLSGGTLRTREGNTHFELESENLQLLEWLQKRLTQVGIRSIIFRRKDMKRKYKTGIFISWKELKKMHQRWYPKEGRKSLPPDFELTPTIAFIWFLLKGKREQKKGKWSGAIRFWIHRFSLQDQERLVKEIKSKIEIPLSLSRTKTTTMLRISRRYVPKFLEYMGEGAHSELKKLKQV